MALKVTDEGYVIIETEADARKALAKFQSLKAERDELYEESGVKDMDEELVALKAATTKFMIDNELERIDGKGFHGTLVKSYIGGHWVTTEDDIEAGDPDGVISLKRIIERKFKSKITTKGSKAREVWMRITKRVADHQAIEELVGEKILKVDEIAPAWVEKEKQPYLRVFED